MAINPFAGESGNFDNENDIFPPEGESLTGNPMTEARLCAVQTIFQSVLVGRSMAEVMNEFIAYQIKPRKADKKIFRTIVEGVTANQTRYEELIAANLNAEWEWDRVGFVEKSILTAAVSELENRPKTPFKVIINEFINISKGFLKEDEVGFINGILNTIVSKIRPE